MMQMEQIFIRILNRSLTAGIVIVLVIFLRLFLKRLPKIFSYLLWAVVLFRLICPVSFSSAVSLFGVWEMPFTEQGRIAYIPESAGLMERPEVILPVPSAEDAANVVLPSAAAENSADPMQILLFVGMCSWASGILIMTVYAAMSYWKLKRKLKTAVRKKDNIYYVSDITTPFVCGFFSPRIYLPEKLADGSSALGDREEQYILLHERIHIERRDYFWRMIGFLALCVHWFNPLVWLAFFLSGRDMEMSCDEAVVRRLGSDIKKDYSALLLTLASGRRIVPGIPLAFGEGETGSRIRNVLRYKRPAQIAFGMTFIICIIAIIVLAADPESDGQENGQNVVQAAEGGILSGNGAAGELLLEQFLDGDPVDGTYRVYARSLSRSARGIERYFVSDADEDMEQPFLAFAEECKFYVNREMDGLRYEKVSFDVFADLMQEAFSFLDPPVLLSFEDGLVTEAILENYYGSGISYASLPPDIWHDHTEELTGFPAEEVLATYYAKEQDIWMDVGDGEGFEHIEVYTGKTGDGESGIVRIQNAAGETLCTASVNVSSVGCNNIYMGYSGSRDGSGFIMMVHIEDRMDHGEYAYYVFRLSEDGEICQLAGSSFRFDDRSIPYDDALLREWTENLAVYMKTGGLLLGAQDGAIRTEADPKEEAERYTYEMLRRGK